MLWHFLTSQNDHLNTKVKIMVSLSAETKERISEKKKKKERKTRKWLKTPVQRRIFCQTKCLYFKNNENTSHLCLILLILTPAAARLGHEYNIWGNLKLWCIFFFYTVHIKVLTHGRIVTFIEISATCFLFSLGSQSRAIEGQQIPVLPAN